MNNCNLVTSETDEGSKEFRQLLSPEEKDLVRRSHGTVAMFMLEVPHSHPSQIMCSRHCKRATGCAVDGLGTIVHDFLEEGCFARTGQLKMKPWHQCNLS